MTMRIMLPEDLNELDPVPPCEPFDPEYRSVLVDGKVVAIYGFQKID